MGAQFDCLFQLHHFFACIADIALRGEGGPTNKEGYIPTNVQLGLVSMFEKKVVLNNTLGNNKAITLVPGIMNNR